MSAYVYPFGPSATAGRIDQGQDFGGTGKILAIGNARVVRTGAPGWPGGAGVLYRLLDGSHAGKYVFVYEGITPTVRAGQVVRAGQPIGSLIPGSSTGIEIGWANSAGAPISHPEYTEGKETVGGKSMAAFLASLKNGGGSSGTDYGGGPLGFAKHFILGDPLEALGIGSGQGLKEDITGGIPDVAGEVISGLAKMLGVNATAILLNVALVGGGGALAYYGIAKMAGVSKPIATPVKAARVAGEASV